jgi:hypothetical protein
MRYLIVSFFFLIVIAFQSCKSPTGPVNNSYPGRRDYTWTVDTILTDSFVGRMWGDSPDNIWVTVSGSVSGKNIFRFDGNTWNYVTNHIFQPNAVFGFGKNKILVGGENGTIWRYNGNSWNFEASLNVIPNRYIEFENIRGESPNDIYAVGAYADDNQYNNNGVLVHYNGSTWEINNNIKPKNLLYQIYNITGTPDYFLMGYHHSVYGDSTLILKYNSNTDTLTILSEAGDARNDFVTCYKINNEIYLLNGNNIYIYYQNNSRMFLQITDAGFRGRIDGRNESDLFIVMTTGIAHYNGSDIKPIYNFENTSIASSLILDKDVFFLAYNDLTKINYIIHGKLE